MKKLTTTEEFILKARLVHGDKYDYSKVEYKNVDDKIIIICPIHGEFIKSTYNHINKKQGCQKCNGINKLTTKEFIQKARVVHDDRYDYSKSVYINSTTKIIIDCSIHGEFMQNPINHLKGHGCDKCGGSFKLSTNDFIEKATNVHGDKYDYSKVEYVNSNTKVIIICHEHGEFEQMPSSHLNGANCPICAGNYSNKIYFLEMAKLIHGDKYDYSKVNYINSHTKVTIICPIHGRFEQNPTNHLSGRSCHNCGKIVASLSRKLTTKDFIEKAIKKHGDKYDYSKTDYINSHAKIVIICPIHGEFEQSATTHLSGAGCPTCAGNKILNLISYNELKTIVRSKGIKSQKEYKEWWKKNEDYCKNNGIPASPQNFY